MANEFIVNLEKEVKAELIALIQKVPACYKKSDDLTFCSCPTFRLSGGDTPSAEPVISLFVHRPVRSHRRRLCYGQARSKRSRHMTLFHAATKSCRNFS